MKFFGNRNAPKTTDFAETWKPAVFAGHKTKQLAASWTIVHSPLVFSLVSRGKSFHSPIGRRTESYRTVIGNNNPTIEALSMSIEKEIVAVKSLLASFFGNPNEADREIRIREEAVTNEYIKTYAEFSKAELKEQLQALQKQLNGECLLSMSCFFGVLFFDLCDFRRYNYLPFTLSSH